MTPVTKEILAGIAADDPEAFLGAAETGRAYCFGSDSGLVEPYSTSLAEHPPGADDIGALKAALIGYLDTGSRPNTASAAFALGKFNDPSLVPLLRSALEFHLRGFLSQNAVVGQLICALHGYGEVISSESHFNLTEVNKNIEDARRYLKGFGKVFPW